MDRMRNETIKTRVGDLSKKVQERRLRWHGHVMRGDEECVGKRMIALQVDGGGEEDRGGDGWTTSKETRGRMD